MLSMQFLSHLFDYTLLKSNTFVEKVHYPVGFIMNILTVKQCFSVHGAHIIARLLPLPYWLQTLADQSKHMYCKCNIWPLGKPTNKRVDLIFYKDESFNPHFMNVHKMPGDRCVGGTAKQISLGNLTNVALIGLAAKETYISNTNCWLYSRGVIKLWRAVKSDCDRHTASLGNIAYTR